jgi:putative ABC transport system permease protein
VAENALRVVALLVVLAGLLGMSATLVTSLGERRREMAVLRAVGAAPRHVFGLLLSEAVVLALAGIALALALFYLTIAVAAPLAQAQFGLSLPISAPSAREWMLLGLVMLAAVIAGLLPAIAAYRRSLSDGLSLRL